MNKNLVVSVVAILIILAVSGYYFVSRQSSPANPENSQPSAQPSADVEKASLKTFLSMGGIQKCEFSDPENNNSGTIYTASGKVRGDFSSNINGESTPTHLINDSKDVYIWMDNQPTGFKTSLAAIEQMSGQTGVSQTVDINKEVEYKCESWSIDPAMFVVPTDKKFNDMSQMMQDAVKMMSSAAPSPASMSQEDKAAACSACEKMEGPIKAQCQAALKCN